MLTTPRRSISYPNPDRTDRPDIPAHIGILADALDNDVLFQIGLDSDRLAHGHQVEGGLFWWTSDLDQLWFDDGTAWQLIGPTFLPPGCLIGYTGATAPAGRFLLADGSAVSRTTYSALSALYAAMGYPFGNGNGTSTFNLPDTRGRVLVGKNAGTFTTLGGTGGEETHILTTPEIPSHNHTLSSDSAGTPAGTLSTTSLVTGIENSPHTHQYTAPNAPTPAVSFNPGGDSVVTAVTTFTVTTSESSNHTHTVPPHDHIFTGTAMTAHTHTIGNTGGGGAHNNLQPYLVVNHIVTY